MLLVATFFIGFCTKDSAPAIPEKKPTILPAISATLGSYLTDTLGNMQFFF